MCVSCGQELCKHCKGCHNQECERYTEPTEGCEPGDQVPLPRTVGVPCGEAEQLYQPEKQEGRPCIGVTRFRIQDC